jgi:hypothetical protein
MDKLVTVTSQMRHPINNSTSHDISLTLDCQIVRNSMTRKKKLFIISPYCM